MKMLTILSLMAMAFTAKAQTVTPVHRVAHTNSQVWGGQMFIKINSIERTAPFTSCSITVMKYANGVTLPAPVTKTVWLKNIPARTVQAFDTMKALNEEQARLVSMKRQLDLKQPTLDMYSDAAVGQYNRDNSAYQAAQVKFDYERPEAQAELKQVEHDRAMPTGQIYGGKEVWDCGLRAGEVPRL